MQELSSPLIKSDEAAESFRSSWYMPNSSWQNQILYQVVSFQASLLEAVILFPSKILFNIGLLCEPAVRDSKPLVDCLQRPSSDS